MTMKSFGKVAPLQMWVLMLAGYGITRMQGASDMVLPKDDDLIIKNIIEGKNNLIKYTDQDFGVSLKLWHEYLLSDEKYRSKYTYSHSWKGMSKAILAEINNPDRSRLEALAESA